MVGQLEVKNDKSLWYLDWRTSDIKLATGLQYARNALPQLVCFSSMAWTLEQPNPEDERKLKTYSFLHFH